MCPTAMALLIVTKEMKITKDYEKTLNLLPQQPFSACMQII
jgi:hypothetical protein